MAEHSDIDFTNNNQDNRDRESDTVGAGVYWNVSPRTSIFANIKETDIDYRLAAQSGFDSDETSATIGIGWEPSYHTSLVAEVGNLEKDLADPGLSDFDSEIYAGRLSWSPSANSNVGIYVSKHTEESTEFIAPFTESELVGISFSHGFTDRLRGEAYVNSIDDDLINVRQDEILDFGIGIFYDLASWVTLGLNWNHTERDSTDPDAEFESNSYGLTATFKPRRAISFESLHTREGLGQSN